MAAAPSPHRTRTALVLGGGGPVGVVWMAGLLSGLREQGIDLGSADRIIGTSAGSIIGAVLAGDGDFARLLVPFTANFQPPRSDPQRLEKIFAILIGGEEPREARRRVGELALAAEVGDPQSHIARMVALLGTAQWPARELVVTSVDIGTGELAPWTRDDGIPLATAVAASTSVPGVYPPIPFGGHIYFDGGMRSPINADLAADADLLVIVEPLAHMFPRSRTDSAAAAATTSIEIHPDAAAIAAFGADVFSPAAIAPAHQAGQRQATDAAKALQDIWR